MKLEVSMSKTRQGKYDAACRTLPGCLARGDTEDEALQSFDEAARGYLAAVTNFYAAHLNLRKGAGTHFKRCGGPDGNVSRAPMHHWSGELSWQ